MLRSSVALSLSACPPKNDPNQRTPLDTNAHTYRRILGPQRALRHIVLPSAELRRAVRERSLHGAFARGQQRSAFRVRRRVALEQREELVPQHGLDLLKRVCRVPAVSFLCGAYYK